MWQCWNFRWDLLGDSSPYRSNVFSFASAFFWQNVPYRLIGQPPCIPTKQCFQAAKFRPKTAHISKDRPGLPLRAFHTNAYFTFRHRRTRRHIRKKVCSCRLPCKTALHPTKCLRQEGTRGFFGFNRLKKSAAYMHVGINSGRSPTMPVRLYIRTMVIRPHL